MMALKKCEAGKKCMDCSLFSHTSHLRLDNTGARVVEVNPLLLCNQMSDNV